MFGTRITLFKLLGFEVHLDLSWLIIAVFVSWSLASGLFPQAIKDLAPAVYWWMGIAGAFGLFCSIVFHELFHSLVARRFGMSMKGITLFVFGGVAEMEDEPPSPRAEFFMAAAGPASSLVLGAAFGAAAAITDAAGWTPAVTTVIAYLGTINFILALFNLLPAFPLDGGRVLRAALWRWKKNLRWATRVSSRIGTGFAVLLIAFGILNIIRGNFLGGLWQFMIGMFLRSAAQASYRQVLVRKALEGGLVRNFMRRDPLVAPPSITIASLVDDIIYRHHHKMYPVVEEETLVGCITTGQVREIPRSEWGIRTVGEIADRCSAGNTISPDADILQALSRMNRAGSSTLLVVDGDRLAGVISLRDIMEYLSMKLDLEDGEG